MSEEGKFTLELEHLEDFAFKVKFDAPKLEDMIVDEPPPLGQLDGPNPSRLLAVATANCLSASLLYCVNKGEVPPGSLRASVTCTLVRNEKKRLRIGGMEVNLTVAGDTAQAARMARCLDLFEDFCVVTASLREGIPVGVTVQTEAGEVLKHEALPES